MTDIADDLRDLGAWADYSSRWMEAAVRRPYAGDRAKGTVVLDAVAFDDFLAGLRAVPGVVEAIAAALERQPQLRIVAGRRGGKAEAGTS